VSLLDQESVQQRGALLARYAGYDERSKKSRQLQTELRQAPLTPADQDAAKLQADKLAELAKLSLEQEVILREIALRREPCKLVFPPVRSTKQVQELLPKGHGLLAFYATARQSYAFLMTKDKYGYWQIKSSPKTFVTRVQSMLQKWGNYEQNKEVKAEELADDRWKTSAKEILDLLTSGSKADLGGGTFEELAIVPDGLLWYVPFEALQVPDGEHTQPLISKLRIRYAPTVGLAVGAPHRRRQGGNTAVVLGRLFPRDDPEVAAAAFEDLSRVTSGAVAIQGKLPAASSVYSTLFDRLVVYSEVTPVDANPYAWSPVPLDQGKPGSALAAWFPLPWGGPDEIILPGFRTSAEHAAKGLSPEYAANELFLSTCGLMATGARTVLISRWRMGGRTSYDLMREFVQELPDTTASDAWQRSIELVSRLPLEPGSEPRFKEDSQHAPPLAENPFFWAGYMLIDTGSSPRLSDEEPLDDQPLALKAAAAAPAGQQGAADPAAEMKPEQSAKPLPAKAGEEVAAGEGGLGLRPQPQGANRRRPRSGEVMPGAGQNPADVREPDGALGGAAADDLGAAEPMPKGKGNRQPRAQVERKKVPPKKAPAKKAKAAA
jgi:CHAT domain-containing protein